MAALPYMQLYIADYLADTMHLSTEEHGAYLLLMFNYWQTGRAIPKNRLAKIARLSNDRWSAVEPSLKEFFNDNGIEWVHERIERDLEAVRSSVSQKSAAGKASARARKAKKPTEQERGANDRSPEISFSLSALSVPLAIAFGFARPIRGRYSITNTWKRISKTVLNLRSQISVSTGLMENLHQSFTMLTIICIAAGVHQSTCRAGPAVFCWRLLVCAWSY